jgi:hypothetical protein
MVRTGPPTNRPLRLNCAHAWDAPLSSMARVANIAILICFSMVVMIQSSKIQTLRNYQRPVTLATFPPGNVPVGRGG